MPGTGRYLVLFADQAVGDGLQLLQTTTGVNVTHGPPPSATTRSFAFENLGLAVVEMLPSQARDLSVASRGARSILAVEPERLVYALGAGVGPGVSRDYLMGYRDAIDFLLERSYGAPPPAQAPAVSARDAKDATWGLEVTGTLKSRVTGRGVRVAVLDTGFMVGHPDFAGRGVIAESFVGDQDPTDRHGHGTHCLGTACGPAIPDPLPRYGIAPEAEVFAGKVLDDQGFGNDGDLIRGLDWALRNNCAVVSISLGTAVPPNEPYSTVFETLARRALQSGTVIVAAAGNDSRRPQTVEPVNHPANCPSIMAVAALDQSLDIASFSNGGVNPNASGVAISGPGVAVYSSWASAQPAGLHRVLSGTSMAAPHVAGIAALWAEATGLRGKDLGNSLLAKARKLNGAAGDVGAGLVQAPQ
jgi:subtilisin family serine protease